jgi:hypothetical protein
MVVKMSIIIKSKIIDLDNEFSLAGKKSRSEFLEAAFTKQFNWVNQRKIMINREALLQLFLPKE